MKKSGFPQRNELVVCRITKLYPNSATVELMEYGKPGIIHVAEVALRWVTDIREHIKEKQFVVCKVLGTEQDMISLSIKRVRRPEAASKLNEFNRELKSEKVLARVAETIGKSPQQADAEAGQILAEEFGSLTKAFEIAQRKPQLLAEKGVPKKWVDAIVETLQKSAAGKTYTVKAQLTIQTPAPNGIQVIVSAFRKHAGGLTAKYLSAPVYTIESKGADRKQVETSINNAAEAIIKDIQKSGGTGSFVLEKK